MILRPGIQTLLQDAQRQQFDVVLAEALDRISRDQADVATLFKHLRFAGVPIITLRYALVRTAEKSTPPYTANWARSSDGSKHKPLERLGNAKLPAAFATGVSVSVVAGTCKRVCYNFRSSGPPTARGKIENSHQLAP